MRRYNSSNVQSWIGFAGSLNEGGGGGPKQFKLPAWMEFCHADYRSTCLSRCPRRYAAEHHGHKFLRTARIVAAAGGLQPIQNEQTPAMIRLQSGPTLTTDEDGEIEIEV